MARPTTRFKDSFTQNASDAAAGESVSGQWFYLRMRAVHGQFDAGQFDAGQFDAEQLDAGQIDAGKFDTGQFGADREDVMLFNGVELKCHIKNVNDLLLLCRM